VFGFLGATHASGPEYRERLSAAGAAIVFDDMRELPRLIGAERARRGANAPVADAVTGGADGKKR
jgi:hypothetical protein